MLLVGIQQHRGVIIVRERSQSNQMTLEKIISAQTGDAPAVAHDFYHYAPDTGHGLKHNPMQAIIGPRPIGWISSVSKQGVNNLAPYSFCNMFRAEPPLLGFASGENKDSLRNIEETGKFVWNLATRRLAEAMNMSSVTVPNHIDEFALSGLTCAPSSFDMPGYVLESPVSFDCELTQIVELLDRNAKPSGSSLIIGEVVHVRIARNLICDGIYETLASQPILRGGGPGDYYELMPEGYFFMKRP